MTIENPIFIGFSTSNPHKLEETEACLQAIDVGIQLVSLVPKQPVDETGSTFVENARIKLQAILSEGVPESVTHVIAEDAGLVIPALDGTAGLTPFPGVLSDRWLNEALQKTLFGNVIPNLTYAHKNQGILQMMATQTNRQAQYQAWLACWERSTNRMFEVSGAMDLRVAEAPRGANGFGYDPIMMPASPEETRTMAELSPAEKNQMSHRFHALSALIHEIRGV